MSVLFKSFLTKVIWNKKIYYTILKIVEYIEIKVNFVYEII